MGSQYTLTFIEQAKGQSNHADHPVRQELARQRAIGVGLTVNLIGPWSGASPNTRTWIVTDPHNHPYPDPNNPVTKFVGICNYYKFVSCAVTAGPVIVP
jgi:hypothetical protein